MKQLPELLVEAAAGIAPPKGEAAARARLDSLTKPQGALGRLEDLAAQMVSINVTEVRGAAYVFAADHGLAAEGVSAYPAVVTRQMVLNFLAGGAAVNVLGRWQGARVQVVDCGVAGEPFPLHPMLVSGRVRAGSRNMLVEAAMSSEELRQALELGLRCAAGLTETVVAVGEMGIGNTASASALTAALTGRPVAAVTGRGTGVDDTGMARKTDVLERVMLLHSMELRSPLEMLRRLGGLEIAAMTGFMIGAAARGSTVVIDGFISTAAAAFALAFAPQVRPYLVAGHVSEERGHRLLLEHLGLRPVLDLGMRLGEGSGAMLAMGLLDAALRLYGEMATFGSAGVSGAEV